MTVCQCLLKIQETRKRGSGFTCQRGMVYAGYLEIERKNTSKKCMCMDIPGLRNSHRK